MGDGAPHQTTDIARWLAAHGFERFTEVFIENEIDLEALRELTDEDLKELGLPLGPRVKMRKAIQALASDAGEESPPAEADSPPPQPEPAPHAEAERRQLTVMFVDMVGSTELSRELDPEDMRQLLLDYQSAVAEAVTGYDGHIARYFGDGVLCYFGWPRAHENAAEEAVRAGLAITQAVASLPSPGTEPLAARVGVATGLVVVGDIIGEGASEEEAVVGETPNLAARLQGLAEPGEVVLSDTTRRLVDKAFTTSSLGAVELKGFSNDVCAFVVTGEQSPQAHFEARPRDETRQLIGREHELAMIRERWKRAVAGEGQAVLLTGEAGIGKSRIVQAFYEGLRGETHYRIRHRWTPFHTDTPLYGSIQHLLSAARFSPEDDDETKLDKLERILMDTTRAPVIAELLGLDGSARYGKLELSSEQLRYETLHALADETVDITSRRPVCMILEDAHWSDATSLELLRLIMDKVRTERFLALLPARPELESSLSSHPILTRITLNRLSTAEVHQLIGSVAGGKSLPQALVEDITAKTDGIPLFVEEVTKSVLESDHVTETEDAFELTVPVDSLAVPTTLQDSLMARLDRQPSAKEVAQVAACVGREFDTESLIAITGIGAPTLQGALDQLCEVDVVSRRGVAPDIRYRFRHALLCDAAYQSLLKAKRRDVHGRIVAFLESRDSSGPEILAQHAYQAGLHETAIQYLRAAASRDFAQSAYTEAAAHAARALRWIRELPESVTRLVTEAKLQVMLAYALIPHEGYSTPRTTEAFDRAADIARTTGDVSISVPALTGKALVRLTRGDHAELASTTDELERICNEDGRDYMRFYGAMMKGFAHLLRGEIEPGRQLLGEAKRLYVDDHERRGLRAGYPMWDSLTWWEQKGAWLAGDTTYDASIAESMALAVRGEHDLDRPAFARCWQPTFYTLIALANEDIDLAYRLTKRTRDLATKHAIPSYVAWSTTILAVHEMTRGSVELAFQHYREARAQTATSGFAWGQAAFQIEFAKALLGRGLVEEARELCGEATETLERTRELWWEPEVLRVDGDVCLAEGNRKGAEAAYRKAIEVAQAQGTLAWERRASASLAALTASRARGDAEERR